MPLAQEALQRERRDKDDVSRLWHQFKGELAAGGMAGHVGADGDDGGPAFYDGSPDAFSFGGNSMRAESGRDQNQSAMSMALYS